jgi:hypothetical protein
LITFGRFIEENTLRGISFPIATDGERISIARFRKEARMDHNQDL